MKDTSLVSSHRTNPALKTVHAPKGWLGSPVDKRARFLNLEYPFIQSLAKVIRWQLQTNPYKKEKKAENWRPPIMEDPSWIRGKDDIIVWLGHASFYVRINGVRIMIDPVFGDILTVKRKTSMPVDPRLFTDIDYVLLSHDHRDHMDKQSLKLLAKQNPDVAYKAGLGSEQLIYDFTSSQRIETAGWYQQFSNGLKPVNITFVPSRHWARRGIFDTNKRLWGGFVIESNGKRILFSGDSGYDSHFRQLGELFGAFNYAIIGIGAYQPSWFMSPMHMSPGEASKAFQELNAKCFIPMHYGTFDLSDEPLGLPLRDLHQAAMESRITNKLAALTIGKPLRIER